MSTTPLSPLAFDAHDHSASLVGIDYRAGVAVWIVVCVNVTYPIMLQDRVKRRVNAAIYLGSTAEARLPQ